jgi:hypothetical protein
VGHDLANRRDGTDDAGEGLIRMRVLRSVPDYLD